MSEYSNWVATRQNTIKTLRELADLIDEVKQRGSKAKLAGSSAGIVGAVIAISCLIATPFTAGVSLFGLGTGAAVGGAGGITSVGANLGSHAHIESMLAKAQQVIDHDREVTKHLIENPALISGTQLGTSIAAKILKSGSDDLEVLATAATAAKVGNVDSKPSVALDLIFVSFKIGSLVSNAIDVHNKTPHQTAVNLSMYVDGLESEYENIKNSLKNKEVCI